MPDPADGAAFASWLKSAMRARGWRQVDVHRATGADPVAVMRWLRGQARPGPHYMSKLAEAFDTDRAELERLAYGLTSNPPDSAQAIEAERQMWRARYDYVMEQKVPKWAWDAYLAACEALADAYQHIHPAPLSTPQPGGLSDHAGENDDPTAYPGDDGLASRWPYTSLALQPTNS